ncbi:predicted protein [Arabidopsis lyrata subsp. lyrata]|uniref:Predicted protein n=1 Tax=Arabidopsis lyrata subsp. lyrata TaxID=81972 RepID=D7KEZ3_ARALL|nr:predicted protein [Arabidopsis lyrata subsp. lyrata]EFH64551.1 predicted protein [Arabidopsis lyrata subsp. lyrata]EFH70458.1 predicted protein [Arabidopsis lyrata subsp. lyrata]
MSIKCVRSHHIIVNSFLLSPHKCPFTCGALNAEASEVNFFAYARLMVFP